MTQRDPNATRKSTQPFNDPVFYRDTQAVRKGREAFKADKPISSCPYPHGSRSRVEWRGGWHAENLRASPDFADIPKDNHWKEHLQRTAMGYAVIK